MGVIIDEVNFELLLSDLSECCLQLSSCNKCKKSECIIGYAKENIKTCIKDGVTYIMDGCENIPLNDSKIFEVETLTSAIAHILKQCKSCKENHFDNCIINILRSCYEVCLFGEMQKYKGSTFAYLNDIVKLNSNFANLISENYSI